MNDRDIFKNVTKGVAFSVKAGLAPWQQVWMDKPPLYPINGATGDPFAGINFLLLASSGRSEDNRWFTRSHIAKSNFEFKNADDVDNGVSVVTRWSEERQVDKPDGSGEKESKTVWMSRIGRLYNAEQVNGVSALDDLDRVGFANPDDLDGLLQSTDAIIDLDGTSPAYLYEDKTICMPPRDGSMIWYTELIRMLARHTANIEDESVARNVASQNGRIGTKEWMTTELATYMIAAELGLQYQPSLDAPSDDSVLRFLEKHNNGQLFKVASTANNIRRYISSMVIENELNADSNATLSDLFDDSPVAAPVQKNEEIVQSKRSPGKLVF